MNEFSTKPTIRRAAGADAPALALLGAATFTETFVHHTPEDLQAFAKESHSTDAWKRKLADPHNGIWIAEIGDDPPIGFCVAGQCKLPVENLEQNAGEIQELYVLATHHNLKLGTQLMEIAFEWLAKEGRNPLYIGVWSENYGAQRLYARHGFKKIGEYEYPVGNAVDLEFILKR